MTARLLSLGFAALAMVVATGCDDPFKATATAQVFEDTLAVYAISEAPVNAPTALNTFDSRVVRTDPAERFDLVFDIRIDPATSEPTAYVLPPRAVGAFSTAGIIKDPRPYEDILRAPTSGYNDSTGVAVKPGDVLLVQAASYACAGQVIGSRRFIYSRLVIDSVHAIPPFDAITNPGGSTIYFRFRVDPNCGFVSFADGLPES